VGDVEELGHDVGAGDQDTGEGVAVCEVDSVKEEREVAEKETVWVLLTGADCDGEPVVDKKEDAVNVLVPDKV
jgi:hypothetical protein